MKTINRTRKLLDSFRVAHGMTGNNVVILLSLVVLTLGQFERIGLGIYLHDLVLGLFILVNVRNIRLALTDKTKKYGWYFIGFALLSLLLNVSGKPIDATVVATGYWLRWTAYYLVFCLLWNNKVNYIDSHLHLCTAQCKRGNDTESNFAQAGIPAWLTKGLLVYCVTVLVIGLGQWFIFPDMRILSVLGWDDHYFRLIGSWLDPNFTGLILVLGGLATVNFMREIYWVRGLGRLGRLGIAGLFIVGILLTYSRSSYLALIIGILFLFRWKVGLLVSLSVGLVILGYAFWVPKPAGEGGNLLRRVSVEARLRSYNRGIAIVKTSPIFGVGFNYYKYAQEQAGFISGSSPVTINSASGNDNSFIFILATTGIVGLCIFLMFWFNLFVYGNPIVKASIAAITIHSFFNNSIFFPAVIVWLWILYGVYGGRWTEDIEKRKRYNRGEI